MWIFSRFTDKNKQQYILQTLFCAWSLWHMSYIKQCLSYQIKKKAYGQTIFLLNILNMPVISWHPFLSICFTGCMIHGLLPDPVLSVLLVPIIKDQARKVSSLDNYRPTLLAKTTSKVLERNWLHRLHMFINFTDNHFDFKLKHGADFCIYSLK